VPESRELSVQQCETLLRVGIAGRVAISTPTGPHMVPVNYTVVDDAIVVRTSPYSLLGTHGRDTMVAFAIDGFDRDLQRGWSVQARGRAEVVTTREMLDRIRQVADPSPWANGVRSLYLRLRWTELTGRQLGATWDPVQDVSTSS
jgi:nitroimidazol reductase NimA-like FMN-containing flavoprotein (pyridoxamine 5'-phosphate oxidase superfamily)